jgi:SAM-dependent MidA family methyltransferase
MQPNSPQTDLGQKIAAEIQQATGQRISFARFMALALYEPELGFYPTRAKSLGTGGDFYTSVHLGADFGELLAEQFVEMWIQLGQPTPFHLVEMGAGQGLIAADILAYLQTHHPDCFASLIYGIIEKVPELVALQQQQLQPWQSQVRWLTWADLPPNSVTGCFFSNELVDAFPVHQLALQGDVLQESYVTLSAAGDFVEQLGDLSTPALSQYFQDLGIEVVSPPYPEGYRTEVNLFALEWLAEVSRCLHQGYLLTIDYGYDAPQYYSPARPQGTLQCYRQHKSHGDPYKNVGGQDITAHVDFSALQLHGERLGLQTAGLTTQALFLMALGLGERLMTNNAGNDFMAVMGRRDRLQQLMNPLGLGGFKVLIQQKNLSNPQKNTLRGLQGEVADQLRLKP